MERFADRADRIKHIAQLGHVGHGQLADCRFVAHVMGKLGTFAQCEAQAQTHRVWDGQNVAEQNGCIQLVALQRLQGHFSGVVGVGGQAHKAAGLGAGVTVLWQVAASLPHQPDRCVGGGLAHTSADEGVVLKRCVHVGGLSLG